MLIALGIDFQDFTFPLAPASCQHTACFYAFTLSYRKEMNIFMTISRSPNQDLTPTSDTDFPQNSREQVRSRK
jgi:hypothetical protein